MKGLITNMGSRVLITDDAAFMRMMLKDIFEKAGYEVVGEARNGAEALSMFEDLHPDLVTMDITMPEVDGITGCKSIMMKYPNANIVMCSAMGQQAMVLDAIKAGAKDFIVKPFEPKKVIEVANKLCE